MIAELSVPLLELFALGGAWLVGSWLADFVFHRM